MRRPWSAHAGVNTSESLCTPAIQPLWSTRTISHQQWRAIIEAHADGDGPVNTAMAPYISMVGAGFAAGKPPLVSPDPDALATALGHRPATFTEFVRERREEFTGVLT